MSEAVTVPSLMVMTSIVSEESLARDTHAHTHPHTHPHIHPHIHTASSMLTFFKVLRL